MRDARKHLGTLVVKNSRLTEKSDRWMCQGDAESLDKGLIGEGQATIDESN